MAKRVVLAYSGGLDTSVAVRWMIAGRSDQCVRFGSGVFKHQKSGRHRAGGRLESGPGLYNFDLRQRGPGEQGKSETESIGQASRNGHSEFLDFR